MILLLICVNRKNEKNKTKKRVNSSYNHERKLKIILWKSKDIYDNKLSIWELMWKKCAKLISFRIN